MSSFVSCASLEGACPCWCVSRAFVSSQFHSQKYLQADQVFKPCEMSFWRLVYISPFGRYHLNLHQLCVLTGKSLDIRQGVSCSIIVLGHLHPCGSWLEAGFLLVNPSLHEVSCLQTCCSDEDSNGDSDEGSNDVQESSLNAGQAVMLGGRQRRRTMDNRNRTKTTQTNIDKGEEYDDNSYQIFLEATRDNIYMKNYNILYSLMKFAISLLVKS